MRKRKERSIVDELDGHISSATRKTVAQDDPIWSAITSQGVLILGADDTISFVNCHVAELLEVPPELIKPGATRREMFDYRVARGDFGPLKKGDLEKLMDCLSPGKSASFEFRAPSGRRIYANGAPMPGGGSIVTYTDVTELRRHQREIAERSAELENANTHIQSLVSNLEAVIENIDYAIVFMDLDFNAEIVNREFREMWGIDKKIIDAGVTMRGLMEINHHQGLYDVDDEDWEDYVEQRIDEVRSGTVAPREFHRKDGKVLSYSSVKLPDGRYMLTYFDITDIKQRELEIARHADALRVVMDSMEHGLTWFDENLKLRAWNRKAREVQQLSEDKFDIGASLADFFRFNAERGEYGPGDIEEQVAARVALAAKFEPHSFERVRSDGRIIRIEGTPVPEGGFVTTYTDMTEQRRSEKQIEFLANHDPLTALPNRRHFTDTLAHVMAKSRASGKKFAVVCFDLDHFKDVNDTLGHPVGDQLLKLVAKRARKVLRKDDTLCRLGGDEFAIIAPNVKSPDEASELASRIIDVNSRTFHIDMHEVIIGVSAGISIGGGTEDDPHQLLRNADLALYSAKRGGRGTYQFFEDEMTEELTARKKLERDLRRALAKDEFRIFYQPQVSAEDRSLVGVEALVRWEHPERGLLAPDQFIGIAEETGLIRNIGEVVLTKACTDIGPQEGLKLAVNLSPVQFRRNDVYEMVCRVLKKTSFDPWRLELEITENVLLLDSDDTMSTLMRLKSLGISIVMDDFGTGYSSLSTLHTFPFDKIKVDRRFIADFGQNTESNAIVHAVISLCKSLGMRANAEGVETHQQADLLRIEHCDELQGYFFGRPMPLKDLAEVIATGQLGKPTRPPKPAGGANVVRMKAAGG